MQRFAKLFSCGWEEIDKKEKSRYHVRAETYRGAYADLCVMIDKSVDKSVDLNLRWWGRRWDWHPQEVSRFFDLLVSKCHFILKKNEQNNNQRIVAPCTTCDGFVTDLLRVCDRGNQERKGDGEEIVTGMLRICDGFVNNLSNYQTTNNITTITPLPPVGGIAEGEKNEIEIKVPQKQRGKKNSIRRPLTPIPEPFTMTEKEEKWFFSKGFPFGMEEFTEYFCDTCKSNESKYQYSDWIAAWRKWAVSKYTREHFSKGNNDGSSQRDQIATALIMHKRSSR